MAQCVGLRASAGSWHGSCPCIRPSPSPFSSKWPTWIKPAPPPASGWRQCHPTAGLAVGHGDGVCAGPEPFSSRCDRAARERLWRARGERSLLLASCPPSSASAEWSSRSCWAGRAWRSIPGQGCGCKPLGRYSGCMGWPSRLRRRQCRPGSIAATAAARPRCWPPRPRRPPAGRQLRLWPAGAGRYRVRIGIRRSLHRRGQRGSEGEQIGQAEPP